MVDIPFPYRDAPRNLLFVNSTFQCLLGIVVFFIGFLFLKKFLKRRTKALQWISLTYLFFGFSIFLAGLQALIAWWQYENVTNPDPLVYGIPLFVGSLRWPLNALAYPLSMLSLLFLLFFVKTVFNKPKREIVYVYTVASIIWIIHAIYNGLFVYIPKEQYKVGASSVSDIGLITFLILGTYVHAILAYYSNKGRKKEQDPIVRTGLTLMMISGVTVIFGYAVFVVHGVLKLNFEFIPWTIGTIAVFLIYLGFSMPEWFRRLLYKRYKLETLS